MPTARPRHTVTETEDLAAALDLAAARWPEESRSRLLLRLVEQGRKALEADGAAAVESRRAAVRATAGAATGSYEPGYLERLREDWPA